MKITDRRRSLEACTESGWDAFDLLTMEPLSDDDIESLRDTGGSFIYMKQLKKPFFKIEDHNHVIKGVRGDSFFRFAVHRDHLDEVDKIVRKYTI